MTIWKFLPPEVTKIGFGSRQKNDFTTHDLAMMFLNIIKKTALDI